MDQPRPTVCRSVHYVSRGSADGAFPSVCRAAIVTEIQGGDGDERVALAVLNPSGIFFDQMVRQDEAGHAPGTWHWPELAVPTAQAHAVSATETGGRTAP